MYKLLERFDDWYVAWRDRVARKRARRERAELMKHDLLLQLKRGLR